MSKNTLLNYFTRTPATTNKPKHTEGDVAMKPESFKTPKFSKNELGTKSTTPKQNEVNGKAPSQKTPKQNGINARTPKRCRTNLEQYLSAASSNSKNGKNVVSVVVGSIHL